MKIGKYEIKEIISGYLSLDGGSMYGVVPKTLWERVSMPDEKNRIVLAMRNMLLKSDDRIIVVDTGIGTKINPKIRNIYNVTGNSIFEVLKNEGLDKNDITDVLLTHLHFDHCGGSTIIENGKVVPAFPNARYYVNKKQFDWAVSPSEKDRASYFSENYVPLAQEGVLKFYDGKEPFDENISFIEVNGHTFGQNLVKISDKNNTILNVADLLPIASHLHLPYIMSFDLQPLVTLSEKKKILDEAVNENWLLFLEHDPEIGILKIEKSDNKYLVKENVK